ncbi:MAG TPA: response regulator [Candidatus Nitrosocosmicus sp.]|nr:response regulator [Candidatus Nitrosocosmicus sp.]
MVLLIDIIVSPLSLEDEYDELDYVNGTIIIVTDNPDINIVLSGVFGLNGFKCFKCTTAEEAIAIFHENSEKVDSILIEGKIAADRSTMLIIKVKNKKPTVKIIVLADKNSTKTRVLDYGADEFVLKPMSAESMTNKVITLLAKK